MMATKETTSKAVFKRREAPLWGAWLLAVAHALPALLPAEDAAAQDPAVLAGEVAMPAARVKKQRSFRGKVYRNRGGSAAKGKKAPATRAAAPKRSRFADVVISAHPLSFTAASQPLAAAVRVEQVDVKFTPRVLPITVGTQVEFVNYDKVYHNVFSLTPGARFDIGRKPTGEVESEQIAIAGQIELFCDIHPEMNATIVSLDTPYFTQPDSLGAYRLEGLPPGEYEIRVYHPDYDGINERVNLAAGQTATLGFALVP